MTNNPLEYGVEPSPSFRVVTQTIAMLVDAYRELNARRLFWITLILSTLVVAGFGSVSITDRGISILGYDLPGAWNSAIIPPATFYKWLFIQVAIPYWLGTLASILALISVGGMFPDLLTSGSIDLYLAKPIGRLRLFLTKYFTGLLFVGMQVAAFSLASFLLIGIKGSVWEWGIFLAIPLVTLFFSYIYCVCVLLGLITRSALASILVTLLLWGALFLINTSDVALLTFRVMADQRVETQERLIAANQQLLDRNNALPAEKRSDLAAFEYQRDRQTEKLAGYKKSAADVGFWQRLIVSAKAPLPKTGETVSLMSGWLVEQDALLAAHAESERQWEARRAARRNARGLPPPTSRETAEVRVEPDDPDVQRQVLAKSTRSLAWVLGTSVGFEAVILGLAAWIFCRRDF